MAANGSYVFVNGDLAGRDVNVEGVESYKAENGGLGVEGEVGELRCENGVFSGVEGGSGVENEENVNKSVGGDNEFVEVKGRELGVMSSVGDENGDLVENGVGAVGNGNGCFQGKDGEFGGENRGFSGVEESGIDNVETINKGVADENVEIVRVAGVENENGEIVDNCVSDENVLLSVEIGDLAVENGEIETSSGNVNGHVASHVFAFNNDLEVRVGESVIENGETEIMVPRFDDKNLNEKLKLARIQLAEKKKAREVIQKEISTQRTNVQASETEFHKANAEEGTARNLVKSKREEIDSLHKVINRVKNSICVEASNAKIDSMEKMISPETMSLRDEKHLICQIKQMKLLRDELMYNLASADEMRQRDESEEKMKVLKKELEDLKGALSKLEVITDAAGRKYHEETMKMREINARFHEADAVYQEAHKQCHDLNAQMMDKVKKVLEEEELARKEENEEKLKEERRLEEKAKAQEALERKKKNADKAQARAQLRAQKEAQQRENEREKRLKKKEKKKGGITDPDDILASETVVETAKEPEKKPAQQPKYGPSHLAKLSQPKASLPPTLRNRGKTMWQNYILIIALTLFCLLVFHLLTTDPFLVDRNERKRPGSEF